MPKISLKLDRIKGIYTFAAAIIGAGILALPVYLAEGGFWPGLLMIILVGIVCIFSALFIAESFLRVKEDLHLPGLALKFLGRKGCILMFLGIFFCTYAALTGYLSGGGQIIYDISGGEIPIGVGIFIYFLMGTLLIYFGIKAIKTASFYLFFIMIFLFLGLLGLTFSHLDFNAPSLTSWGACPGMLGILMFAFGAHTLVPSLGKDMRRDPEGFKKICIWGVLIPLIFYGLWFAGVFFTVPYNGLGSENITALNTQTLLQAKAFGQPATIPLAHLIGRQVLILGSFFALFSIFTSFIGFGLAGKDSLVDFLKGKVKKWLAVALLSLPPLIFSLFHPTSFLGAIDIAGFYGDTIFMGVLPPLILLRSRKIGERIPEFTVPGGKTIPILVFLFYAFAMVYKTVSFFL